MSAILQHIPLGNKITEIGLILRNTWFLNGCLFNSEAWTGFTGKDLSDLDDHKILRLITGSEAKAPNEMLYLETAQLAIKHGLSVRRILYLHTLLNGHKDEIARQVFQAMKEAPLKDDWINLVNKDLNSINMSLNDEEKIEKTL